MRKFIFAVAILAATPVHAWSQNGWDDPFPAHQVMDNPYFMGTAGLGTFLITTPEGPILINTNFERTIRTPGHTNGLRGKHEKLLKQMKGDLAALHSITTDRQ